MPADPGTSPFWPADNPAVSAHITLLQGIITRLANNSASCKTWCLTLVAALLGVAGTTHTPGIVTAALIPVAIFGFLDVMYLATEVAYRHLYGTVVAAIRAGDYTRDNVFEARARPDAGHVIWALSSWSIVPYYGLLVSYAAAQWLGLSALLAK